VEYTRWTGDNKWIDAIVEGDAKLGVVGEIFVGCGDMISWLDATGCAPPKATGAESRRYISRP